MNLDNGDELALIDSARLGDEAAFEALVQAHAPRLLRLALGILGESHAAEDAVQEALVQAWKGLSNFRGDAALATWLHTITVRTCRRYTATLPAVQPWPLDHHVEALWADPDYTVDPVAVLSRSARREELRNALDSLPEAYRVAVLLHDVEGLSAARVAVVTRCPLGTAKARIRRGRAALVTALAAASDDADHLGAAPARDAERNAHHHDTHEAPRP